LTRIIIINSSQVTIIAIYEMFRACHFEPLSILRVSSSAGSLTDTNGYWACRSTQSLSLHRNDSKSANSIV